MKSFIPFIIIAISIAAYYLYLSPMYADIGVLQAKKAEYTGALAKAKELGVKRDKILAEYNAIPPESILRLKRIIPDNVNNVEIVTNINAIASQYGMSVRGVKIDQQQSQDRGDGTAKTVQSPFKTLTIGFTVSGSYDQFLKFLKDLESNARLFDVSNLAIKNNSKGKTGFDFTVEVKAYSLN